MPGMPAGTAEVPPPVGPTALVQPPPAYVTPLWLATCAAAVHAGGTDSLPTRVLPDVFTETPTFGTAAGAGGCGATIPVTPAPPVAISPGPNELMSARPLKIPGVMSAGLVYPADTKPFTRPEFRNVPMELPSAPSRKLRIWPRKPKS